MQIKFLELLQQSGNFMRNQRSFSLFAVGSIVALQLLLLLGVNRAVDIETLDPQSIDASQAVKVLLPTVLAAAVNSLINLLIILNIQSINHGTYQHFFQNLGAALKAFFPVLLLTLIMVLPLSLGFSFVMASGSILALPLVALGLYLFVKLSLAIYVYLLEKPQKTLSDTVKFTMQLSRGKMIPLLLFTVISSLIPNLVANAMMALGNDLLSTVVKVLLTGIITVFVAVFSFRFYQIYRDLPAKR